MTESEKQDTSFLEAAGELAETAIDAMTSNEAIAAIPVFGTAVRILKGGDDIRTRAFAAKLERFVRGLEPEEAKAKMQNRISESREEARKVGETLYLVLERITDLDKPEMLARIFVAYLKKVITSTDLRRLAQALEIAFVDDINELVNSDELSPKHQRDWKDNLISSGLSRVQVWGDTWDEGSETNSVVSPLGHLMIRALTHDR